MNARIAAVLNIRAIDDRQDVWFSQAGAQIIFQRLAREIGEIAALAKIDELFFAPRAPDTAELRSELDQLGIGKLALQFSYVAVGHGAHAHQPGFAFAESAFANFVDDHRHRRRPVPAHVFKDRLGFGAWLVIKEMNEDGRVSAPWE